MKFFKSAALSAILALLIAGLDVFAYTPDTTTTRNLADGLVYKKYTYNNLYGGYQEIFILEIDLSNPGIEVGIGVCRDNLLTDTGTQGKNNNAYAAVNLGFAEMTGNKPSTAVGVLKACGKMIKGASSELSSLTEGYLWVDKQRAGVVTRNGFTTGMADNIRYCYPVLLQKGAVYPELIAVTSDPSQVILSRRSRTAIGITSSRQKMYVAVVDEMGGRRGVTCKELADYMLSLGCYEALNMDGGGSSTMWTSAYGLMSRPQNGTYQRPVYDILFVRPRQASYPENRNSASSGAGMGDYTPKGGR